LSSEIEKKIDKEGEKNLELLDANKEKGSFSGANNLISF